MLAGPLNELISLPLRLLYTTDCNLLTKVMLLTKVAFPALCNCHTSRLSHLLLLLPSPLLPSGRKATLTGDVATGKADAGGVVDDALRTMRRQAESLKASSKNQPGLVAAADKAIAELEVKSKELKASVAAGKTCPTHAVEDTLVSVEATAAQLKAAADKASTEAAVKDTKGE